jgi:teichoic acid transport system permease protein
VHDFIALVRAATVSGMDAPAYFWWIAIGSSAALLVIGFVFFWSAEEQYGRD